MALGIYTRYARSGVSVLVAAALLSACGSAPDQPTVSAQIPQVEQPDPGLDTTEIEASAYADQFAAVTAALDEHNWMAAEIQLGLIAEDAPLTASDRKQLALLRSRIAWQRGDAHGAAELLPRLTAAPSKSQLDRHVAEFQRTLLAGEGNYLANAHLAVRLLELETSTEQAAALKRDIWLNLMRTPQQLLEQAGTDVGDSNWEAWISLAIIARGNSVPGKERQQLQQWLAENLDHEAANPLPGGLGSWLQEPTEPHAVALILPLSGRLAPAAKAVRDGYLASYYAAQARGQLAPELIVVDTTLFDSTQAAYNHAVARGAELVVGPLTKQAVADLANTTALTVPVIALNRAEQPIVQGGAEQLVQFSLAPEDEAHRLAELAYGAGKRRALLIHPAGEWGSKMAYALSTRWQQLGGVMAGTATYAKQEEYSSQVESAFNLAQSSERAKDIRAMLGTNIEFTARRRQDIDSIFLLARTGAEARSIKPLFAYHYAGKISVFSTSSIYSGLPDPRDTDLDNIHLVDMPWLLGSNAPLRVAIAAGDTGSDAYTRLNALGADAFRLQTRLAQLNAGREFLIRGDTGLLTMDESLKIHRETLPATFAGGTLQPL